MWTIHIPKRVEKEIAGVPPSDQESIRKALRNLETSPFPSGVKKLHGKLNAWRIRAGVYRIIYDVLSERKTVVVLKVAHRREVYRLF